MISMKRDLFFFLKPTKLQTPSRSQFLTEATKPLFLQATWRGVRGTTTRTRRLLHRRKYMQLVISTRTITGMPPRASDGTTALEEDHTSQVVS